MRCGRLLMGTLYMTAGALHFVFIRRYMAIIPPYLSTPRALVLFSGVAEIAGGAGVLSQDPRIRRSAAWGIVGLLVAVMPANIYMATAHDSFPAIPLWMLWARVPLQLPLIWWAWQYTGASIG
ncbi:MAG: DoxX family protein [Acidobacteriaceae bacterium]